VSGGLRREGKPLDGKYGSRQAGKCVKLDLSSAEKPGVVFEVANMVRRTGQGGTRNEGAGEGEREAEATYSFDSPQSSDILDGKLALWCRAH
jgi:hypothetical protein